MSDQAGAVVRKIAARQERPTPFIKGRWAGKQIQLRTRNVFMHLCTTMCKHYSSTRRNQTFLRCCLFLSILHNIHMKETRSYWIKSAKHTMRSTLSRCINLANSNKRLRASTKVFHYATTLRIPTNDGELRILAKVFQYALIPRTPTNDCEFQMALCEIPRTLTNMRVPAGIM